MISDPLFYAAAIPAILLMGISKGGIGSGALTFRYFDEAWIRAMLGTMSLAFVAHRYLRRGVQAPAPRSAARGLFWSAASGVTSTIAHAGGPPLSVYLLPQRLEKSVLVGTTVVFFAVVNFVKLVPYAWLGLFDARNSPPPRCSSRWRRWESGWACASCAACPSRRSIACATPSCSSSGRSSCGTAWPPSGITPEATVFSGLQYTCARSVPIQQRRTP